MMRTYCCLAMLLIVGQSYAQSVPKQIPATRTTASIKIDGNIDEPAWTEAVPATHFVEWRPNFGQPEDSSFRTVIYFLYDNTSVYIGGYCYERSRDSISKELVGRDQIGVSDYIGVIFDTYNDKINGSGFYVTPYGEQFDAKYSNSNNNDEDPSWNAVWHSEARIHDNGWSFEMRIPYSAIRFSSKEVQTWGLNITRKRNKAGRQYMWNPVDPKVNGLMNQEGFWTGLRDIRPPVRLSLSPYFSTYLNHYPNHDANIKDWTTSVNGGMDVKYGINQSFTLDMTLVPDFGQVQSDNRVLNLTPFEVKYNENRSFFTEGTELFNKGNLFYSRRIGSIPIHYYDVADSLSQEEHIVKNPQETKLINATKISGRTQHGLGIGFFNAITKPMYAEVEDDHGNKRRIQTNPLTNYNIMVLDQTLKNNSAISLINTSVIRNGKDRDANVTAGLFDFNNKKNTYNWNGKFYVSRISDPAGKPSTGYSHNIGFGKTGGRWNFQIGQELANDRYDINDLGILQSNNYMDHFFWTGYKWLKPGKWYNRIQVNYNAYYSFIYKRFNNQQVNSKMQVFQANVNANAQLKNLWMVGIYFGYVPHGHDFYEAHEAGYVFYSPVRKQLDVWFNTNEAKKYYVNIDYFVGARSQFHSANHKLMVSHRYRFSDKFSIGQDLFFNPIPNDAGFYDKYYGRDGSNNEVLQDVIFSRRDVRTVEDVFKAKYNFNYRSGITIRFRHYWSLVHPKQLYDLKPDGSLQPTVHADVPLANQNFNIFNVDAVYTWQFAPGSFLNIVWKDESFLSNDIMNRAYFNNLDRTLAAPQNNNLSVKLIYYLDYLDVRKRK